MEEGKPANREKGEFIYRCPSCGKQKFYWNIHKLVGQCKVCKHTEYGKQFYTKNREIVSNSALDVNFLGQISASDLLPAHRHPDAKAYMSKRGVSADCLVRSGTYYDPVTQFLYFPNHRVNGDGASGVWLKRSINSKIWLQPTGIDKTCYVYTGGASQRFNSRDIVLVEGVFDLLVPGLLGFGAAILGSSLSDDHLLWLHRNQYRVMLWMDNDEAGDEAKVRILSQCADQDIPAVLFKPPGYEPGMDPADWCKTGNTWSKTWKKCEARLNGLSV
jgi:hypothetical protein